MATTNIEKPTIGQGRGVSTVDTGLRLNSR